MNDTAVVQESDRKERLTISQAVLRPTVLPEDETLIADARAGVTPSQFVERKLLHLLGTSVLPVSHLQTAARQRRD